MLSSLVKPIKLVTSIVPHLTRRTPKGVDIGREYLATCIESWVASGVQIVTVNTEAEQKILAALIPAHVHCVNDDKTGAIYRDRYGPTLGAAFDATAEADIAGFFNADTFIPEKTDFGEILAHEGKNCFILARRTDVEGVGERFMRVNESGFDAIFFDRSIFAPVFEAQEIRQFQMGVPWWDLIVPVAASFHGPLAYIPEPFLLHLDHGKAWSGESYQHSGLVARDAILTYARRCSHISNDARNFAREFSALQDKLTNVELRKQLFQCREFYLKWIWTRAANRSIDCVALTADSMMRRSFGATMKHVDRPDLQLASIDSGAPPALVLSALRSDLSTAFRLAGRHLEQWTRYKIRRQTVMK